MENTNSNGAMPTARVLPGSASPRSSSRDQALQPAIAPPHEATEQAPAHITQMWGKNFLVDEENNRVQFLDSRFYKAGENLYVPSVTTILEAYPKGVAFMEWLKKNGEDSDEIRDEAGRSGSTVHKLTEAYDYGATIRLMDPDGNPLFKRSEWAMFERYVEFRDRFKADIHAIELNMVSAELGYAGTLDRVLTLALDGVTYLADIKTSNAVHTAHWLQQAAYEKLLTNTGLIARLFPDKPVPEIKLAILHLNAKTRTAGKGDAIQGIGWQFLRQEKSTNDLLRLFNCVRATWLEENATTMPKLTEYKLEHSLNTPEGVTQ